jgi:hypothetical protein
VAVEGTLATGLEGTVNATADLGNDRASDGHVWHEVAVHDVDMEPVGALLNLLGAVMTQVGEVGAQDGGSDDRGRGCHIV